MLSPKFVAAELSIAKEIPDELFCGCGSVGAHGAGAFE
jgi:hypothetical protein